MKPLPWILVGILAAALIVSFFMRGCSSDNQPAKADTVWLPVRIDTIRDTVIPPPVSQRPSGSQTARLPLVRPLPSVVPSAPGTSGNPADTVADTLSADSVDVLVPITEKEYRTDDYRIVISGYNPELRAVEFYRRTQVGVVTPPPQRKKRWSIGPCIGTGVAVNGKPTVMIGLSVQYSLLSW